MAISIVNRTTYNGSAQGGPTTVTIPATTAGNTIVVVEMDASNSGNLGFQVNLGSTNLTQSPADVAFLAAGANIWYLTGIAGSQTQIAWPGVSPGAAVIYELSPCTYNNSQNDNGGHSTGTSEIATAITGSGNCAYFTVIGQGTINGTGAATFSSVSSPWSLDFTESPLYNGPFGGESSGASAVVLNTTGTLQATFTLVGPFSGTYGSSAIAFADSSPSTGNIKIVKATNPTGSSQVFTFTPSYGSPFTLTDGQNNLSGTLAAGVYSVTENAVTGWATTTSSDPAHITVTSGVVTTVTFTNTTSNIVVEKVTVPSASAQQFTFTTTYGAPFILTNGGSNNSGPLTPGVYAVTELPMIGWSVAASQDPLHITTTAGPLTVTFTNTLFPTGGGGSGPGGNPNVYVDYNVNQQCWNLPGLLQMPVCSALGSIETSPGVWRLLVCSNVYDNTSGTPVFVQSTLAYRDINNFQDLGTSYAPVAVFGSIQLADPGALAKFGGRGGFVFEYTNAGIAPALSVLPNDIGCDLTKAMGAQVVGNFAAIPAPLPSPPTLGNQPANYRSLTYYWLKAKAISAFVRHLQFMLQAPAENEPTELIGFGIFGDEKSESGAPGQIPTLQGR